jgi:hypothetical protein
MSIFRSEFYESAGRLADPRQPRTKALRNLTPRITPEEVTKALAIY